MSLHDHDHRVLNRDLEIFDFDEEAAPGAPLWRPEGVVVKELVLRDLADLESMADYHRIESPPLVRREAFARSGHLDHYAHSMYSIDGGAWWLRPMSCPQHHRFFASRPRLARDLPFRVAEFGRVFRDEPSGALAGLSRVRAFVQNDGHVYVLDSQVDAELDEMLRLQAAAMALFGVKIHHVRLSAGESDSPEWRAAEERLRAALRRRQIEFVEERGEAAFYGPKIDFQIEWVSGRRDSLASIQLDLEAGHRFGLQALHPDGRREAVVVLHRALIGSLERFIGYWLEQCAGWLPFRYAPVQVLLCPIAGVDVQSIAAAWRRAGLRVALDDRAQGLAWKIKEAHRRRIPVVAVIGERELAAGRVSVRERDGVSLVMDRLDFERRMRSRSSDRSASDLACMR